MSIYSPVDSEIKSLLENMMKVDHLKSCLKLLRVPYSGNKELLLTRFWSAYINSVAALNSDNAIPLKIFANALVRMGKVDVIQLLKLHIIKEISGYQETDIPIFRQCSSGSESEALWQWDHYSIFRSVNITNSPLNSQEKQSSQGVKACNALSENLNGINSSSKQKPNLTCLTDRNTPGYVAIDGWEVLFEKPPNFSTLKCLKQFVWFKKFKMESPVSFTLNEQDKDLNFPENGNQIRIFIAYLEDFALSKLKDSVFQVSTPPGLVAILNGHLIYQDVSIFLVSEIGIYDIK